MLIIHKLKICYQDSPKLASTALFLWFYKCMYGVPYDSTGKPIHNWFWKNSDRSLVDNVSISEFVKPEGYFVFTVTRDPVKRLISAYRNRVLHFGELNGSVARAPLLAKKGLRERPEIDYFVCHLEEYRQIEPSIAHHTASMVSFIGRDMEVYDKIYDISETEILENDLRSHWASSGVEWVDAMSEHSPRAQEGGPKLGLEALKKETLLKAIDFYREDYGCLVRYDPRAVVVEWEKKQSRVSKGSVKALDIARPVVAGCGIEDYWLFETPSLLDDSGLLGQSAGIVVVSENVGKGYIAFSDADGDGRAPWLPSPRVADQFHTNAHAKVAKFVVQGLRVIRGKPAEIFWVDENGERHLLFSFQAN